MKITLSQNIRALRRERSMTQEQLSEALGVSVGTVSKWESGASVPELETIVELAEFFETSVDVLLGYGWQQSSMGAAAERIRTYRLEKRFSEGCRFAEKALQKYPNSFEVCYQSATLYFVQMSSRTAHRSLELFERSCQLIAQNTDPDITLLGLQDNIAICYADMGQYDKAIELLKANNAEGRNNSLIGNILSQHCNRPDEALHYLSIALARLHGDLFRVTFGCSNAYAEKGQFDPAIEILLWMRDLSEGLTEPGSITFIDKTNARNLTACAEIAMMQGDEEKARDFLIQAIALARKFDTAPNYSMNGIKYYHGPSTARSYDDFGKTAMEGIDAFIHDEEGGIHLQNLWKELTQASTADFV